MFRPLVAISLFVVLASAANAADLFFEKDIRPILKAHCFQCHGEDEVREANLDLRLRRFIAQGGDSGAAIEAGEPGNSLILERVSSGEMPPGDKPLSDEQIQQIQQWIEQGAKTARAEPETVGQQGLLTDEEKNFWAFQPIKRPALPIVRNPDSVQSPIDAFVLAKLEDHGFGFSHSADRRTIIRRLSFNLLGLPPTPAAIDEFLADDSLSATAKLIDRLLASPEYGERWGRHWLDVAGYADSEGYAEEDRVRPWAYRFRDYVIKAFNDDMPLDQFVFEQLAGDEMVTPPYQNMNPADIEKLAATGFLRMAPDGTASGGIDQNVARNQTIADTINIVSTSLLGMTVGCAQCHNHRYDPISQVDYYRMRAIFEPALDWKTWKNPATRQISLYTDADRELKKEIEAEAAKVDAEKKERTDFYINRTLEEELKLVDQSKRDPLRTAYKTAANERTEEQNNLLKEHPSVQNISPGSLYLYDQRRDVNARKIDAERGEKLKRFLAETREQALGEVPAEDRDALLAAEKVEAGERNDQQRELAEKYAGLFVAEATLQQFNPAAAAELEADRQQAEELRTTKSVDDLKRYTERAAEIRKRIPPEGFIRALTETPGHAPTTFVFHRGDHEQPRQKVEPGELNVLASFAQPIAGNAKEIPTTGRRLAYAKHLTSGKHPLVARVIVNRIWAHHFGRGLVGSLGDFGMLGERPTHPELLDWLATEFMESGWQLKRLHRLILNSTTYQQTSRRSDQLDRVDPDNHLYGRMSVRRLESEVVRDSMLEICGDLNREMFGPPVPVMEDEVGQIVIGKEMLDGERKPQTNTGLGAEEVRRSVYVQVRRSRPLAVLETFDAPRMTPNCTERNASNVAPQPLLMMNSEFAIRHARRLADRVVSEVGGEEDRQIERAWKLTLGAEPSDEELSSAKNYLRYQAKILEKKEDVLATLCQALISTNQFLYVD